MKFRSLLRCVRSCVIAASMGMSAICAAADGAGDDRVAVPVADRFASQGHGASSDFMAPKGTPRLIEFVTSEGTHISVDVAPDGKRLAFDLLGQIYVLAIEGGRADCLTQGSGVALNYHPRFSPDGSRIAFVSDRSGQANIWTMRSDGSDPQPVYLDRDHRYATPVWAADGTSVFATQYSPTPGRGWWRRNASIWRLPLRGQPRPLLASTTAQYYVASLSPDGHSLYFYSSSMERGGASIYETGFRIHSLELATGAVVDLIEKPPVPGNIAPSPAAGSHQLAYDSGGSLKEPADIVPTASPDGRYLAFARSQPNEEMTYRGHAYRSSTGLFVLDLKRGIEQRILDPITKDLTNAHAHYSDTFLPGFAWTPDSRNIVISVGGKIVRVSVEGRSVENIPFRATVQRIISGQVRRRARLDPDDAVPVRFIQWPASSSDGRHLIFAAIGRLWRMDLPAGRPEPLTPDPGSDVQITPAWSPDGTQVAFATWNENDRGQVWKFDLASSTVSRVSATPGEYIWPTWAPNGEIVALRGPGASDNRDAWDAKDGWNVVRFSMTGESVGIARAGTPWQPLQVDSNGRIYFAAQWDRTVSDRVDLPYADPITLQLGAWNVLSVDANGGTPRIHARFRAGRAEANVPVVSQDGRWIAYQADYQIFAEPLDVNGNSTEILDINSDPRHDRVSRLRADVLGGVFPRWRDARTLEFAAGNRYVIFDVISGARREVPISLQYKRDRASGTVALRNAQIITMDGNRVIRNGTVVAREGRLVCIGSCSTKGIGHVIDLAGKTVIPGLIDVHDHLASEDNGVVTLRRPNSLLPLAYGVTSIIDPAVPSTTLFPLADMTDAGRALGPRTFGSADEVFGSVGGPEGSAAINFGPSLDIRSAADAEYQVARRAAWGAVTIKNYRQASRQQQQLLIEAARRHGLSVTSEGSYVLADLGMVIDGQQGWEHFLPAVPLYQDVAKFVGQAQANYSPTLSVAGFPDGAMFYYRPRADLPHDVKFQRFASEALLEHVTPRGASPPSLQDFAFPILAEGVADIIHAGGRATVGEHAENPGIGTHWEMWTYATALKPIEVLRMATLFGAQTIGLERDIGSLEVGKLADLVVLNADPLRQIENTADIAYVMKGGHLYDGSTLKDIWPALSAH